MGKRAEGAALVVDALNTIDAEVGTDAWAASVDYLDWCASRNLEPGSLPDARALRDRMRAALTGRPSVDEGTFPRLPIGQSLDGSLNLTPGDAPGAIAAAVVTLTITGDWPRIKLCPADDCLQAFFDRSRNRSRVWCAMSDCGNLAKTRTYRSRHGD